MRTMIAAAIAALAAGPALAELVTVNNQIQFVKLVDGKTLTRPLVMLTVSPDGQIEGRGSVWDIEGTWSWQDGDFCRRSRRSAGTADRDAARRAFSS